MRDYLKEPPRGINPASDKIIDFVEQGGTPSADQLYWGITMNNNEDMVRFMLAARAMPDKRCWLYAVSDTPTRVVGIPGAQGVPDWLNILIGADRKPPAELLDEAVLDRRFKSAEKLLRTGLLPSKKAVRFVNKLAPASSLAEKFNQLRQSGTLSQRRGFLGLFKGQRAPAP